MSGPFVSQALSHFRFGQTWSETKTLQIVLESLCVHSPAHSCTFPREALLACPPSSPWNLVSFTVDSTHSPTCYRPDPLSLAKVRLSLTLTFSHLTIWYSAQTALFRFLLVFLVVSLLLSLVFTVLFFRTGGVLSLNSSTGSLNLH